MSRARPARASSTVGLGSGGGGPWQNLNITPPGNDEYMRYNRLAQRPSRGVGTSDDLQESGLEYMPYVPSSRTTPQQDSTQAFINALSAGKGAGTLTAPQFHVNVTPEMYEYWTKKRYDAQDQTILSMILAMLRGQDPKVRQMWMDQFPELREGYERYMSARLDLDGRLTDIKTFGPQTKDDFTLLYNIATKIVPIPKNPIFKTEDASEANVYRGVFNPMKYAKSEDIDNADDRITEYFRDIPGLKDATTFKTLANNTMAQAFTNKQNPLAKALPDDWLGTFGNLGATVPSTKAPLFGWM